MTAGRSRPTEWSDAPGATYEAHSHPYHKTLVCTAGSITFYTPDGDVRLTAGDRLDLPAGTVHRATVGPDGVTCVETYGA